MVGRDFDGGVERFGHIFSTGRDGKVEPARVSRRDGAGRDESTAGSLVDRTGRDHGTILMTVFTSRPVRSPQSIPSRQRNMVSRTDYDGGSELSVRLAEDLLRFSAFSLLYCTERSIQYGGAY